MGSMFNQWQEDESILSASLNIRGLHGCFHGPWRPRLAPPHRDQRHAPPTAMTLRSRVASHLLAAVALLAVLPPIAIAKSRLERAVEHLDDRMAVAEHRYREALVLIGNNDPAGVAEADAALEDMEDVVVACEAQRGCNTSNMLAAYKRLLKQDADAQRLGLAEPGSDDRGVVDSLVGDVPEAGHAAHLLEDGHVFDEMVEFNPAVQQAIRRWLTDMRPELMTSYEN